MVMAIPRELSLGYWLRIKRTLPTHYRYAMMTIHMREYHFDETKQKESMTFTLQIPWIVLVKMQNCTSSSSSLLIQILTVFSYFQLFSVFFQFRWISVSCCSCSSVEPCQPQFRWEARLLLSSVELQYGHCNSNAYDARASRLCA